MVSRICYYTITFIQKVPYLALAYLTLIILEAKSKFQDHKRAFFLEIGNTELWFRFCFQQSPCVTVPIVVITRNKFKPHNCTVTIRKMTAHLEITRFCITKYCTVLLFLIRDISERKVTAFDLRVYKLKWQLQGSLSRAALITTS